MFLYPFVYIIKFKQAKCKLDKEKQKQKMKRFVVILISTIVVVSMIFTGLIVHKKNAIEAESKEEQSFRAPPEGLNEDQVMDYFINNATAEESVRFEDGKEVVEEQASYAYCKNYRVTTTYSSRSRCYSALYARGCKYPCLIITDFIYLGGSSFRYTCQCW
jgi:hypothetical protein